MCRHQHLHECIVYIRELYVRIRPKPCWSLSASAPGKRHVWRHVQIRGSCIFNLCNLWYQPCISCPRHINCVQSARGRYSSISTADLLACVFIRRFVTDNKSCIVVSYVCSIIKATGLPTGQLPPCMLCMLSSVHLGRTVSIRPRRSWNPRDW